MALEEQSQECPNQRHSNASVNKYILGAKQCVKLKTLFHMERNELIGVYVNKISFDEPDFFIYEPIIEGFLVDKSSGNLTKGNSSESNLFSYKSPFTLTNQEISKSFRPFSANWNKLLVIDVKFSNLTSENKILFFEISKKVKCKKTQELENKRIAWAFLIPVASDGSMNTNQDLKLQLYKIRKDCKISHQDCNIFHLYTDHKLKKLTGFIQISVKGVVPDSPKASAKKEIEAKDHSRTEEKQTIDFPPSLKSSPKTWEWSRLPTQSCKVPNKSHRMLSLGKNEVSCLQFSRSGFHIASAVLSKILVHEVISGAEVIVLKSHVGFIYELDWSFDDQYLLSVSNDCRGAIWTISQKTPLFVLPHPSYIYCGKWFGDNERIITGGKDHMLRFWCRNKESFGLVEEIPGHSGFVSALETHSDSLVFSGDSHGCVMVWKYSEGNFALLKEFSFSGISKNVVDSIHLHSSRKRIVVSIRARGSYLVDVSSGVILQTYKSSINAVVRLGSCLTPCGSLLFSFRQNGDVGVWEVNTGRLLATYDNLFPTDHLSDLSGYIRYHPHEHMVAISALAQNFPVVLLKYDITKSDDSERLGLHFIDKKTKQ